MNARSGPLTTPEHGGLPIEVELKYRVLDPAAGQRFLAAQDIGGFRPKSPVQSVRVEDRYVDTADGAIGRAGFAARIRQSGGETIVAVKSTARPSGDGAVHRRQEHEGPADRTADPHDWPPSGARSLLLELSAEQPLVELVTIRQRRRKRILERDGTSVELSLDAVDAVSERRVVGRFLELEVELISGDESALSYIDRALASAAGLAPADSSKLQRGLKAVAAAKVESAVVEAAKVEAAAVEAAPVVALAIEAAPVEAGPVGGAKVKGAKVEIAAVEAAPILAAEPGRRQSPRTGRTKARGPQSAAGSPPPSPAVPPRLAIAKTPGVQADDSVAEAGRKVLRFHLARMIAREPGARSGEVPEELHAMRVATRRQRAAWRIFGEAFRPGRTKAYRGRLREVAARLGAVRDLDVLLAGAVDYQGTLPDDEARGLEPLLAAWRKQRDEARVLLVRELDSVRHRRWLDGYAEFVRHEGKAVLPFGPTVPHRISDTAASRIQAAYERVRAYEPVVDGADVETLHQLRIAGKWLRYSMEFVRETLGQEIDDLIARVTALQDHLGLMHDADVAAHLARDYLDDNAGALSAAEAEAIGRYLVRSEQERDRLVGSIGPRWRSVAGLAFRRRLGRALAEV